MSSDKGKLFVFDRVEVFFILILIILVAITSFTLGVKIGKDFTYAEQGFTPEDRTAIELKSQIEEEVSKIDEQDVKVEIDNSKILQEKFDKIEREELRPGTATEDTEPAPAVQDTSNSQSAQLVQDLEDNAYKGKWTIQLGSYENLSDAQKFADGFKVRGYNPIINEVTIEGRGVWYRVGLGVHDSVADAKAYIDREQTLFQGQDYTIVKLQ